MVDISVIIPYHNESKTIETTLDLIAAQTLPPMEVLLINSSSTDDSFRVVQNWIEKNGRSKGTIYRNLDEGTNVPGSSMNVGIRRATSNILAFMDCGLLFDRDWLQNQMDYMQAVGGDVVSGLCHFEGTTLFDKSAIAQTYGYQRSRPTVPSSLVKKSVFEKTGLFLEKRRAGHDVDWVNKLAREKIRRDVNHNVWIRYNGINYAKSLKDIIRKTIRYSENTVGLHNYYAHHIYGFFLLSLAVVYVIKIRFFRPWPYNEYIPLAHIDKLWLYVNMQSALLTLLVYTIIRGYLIPLIKSRNSNIFRNEPLSVLTLPVIGFVIDAGRVIGYVKGIFRFLRNKMNKPVAA